MNERKSNKNYEYLKSLIKKKNNFHKKKDKKNKNYKELFSLNGNELDSIDKNLYNQNMDLFQFAKLKNETLKK
jgi:hypothetical protein